MKLVDKNALVAEIIRRRKAIPKDEDDTRLQAVYGNEAFVLTQLLEYIDTLEVIEIGVDLGDPKGDKSAKYIIDTNTLEVKEVDLDTKIEDYINSHFTEGCDGGMISDWYKVLGGVHYKDLVEISKHFFELGLKTQKGE